MISYIKSQTKSKVMNSNTYPRSRSGEILVNGSILIHLPLGFGAGRSSPSIKHHALLHSDHSAVRRVNVAWRAGRLPVAGFCSSTGLPSSYFSFLPRNEEEPLLRVAIAELPTMLCIYIIN